MSKKHGDKYDDDLNKHLSNTSEEAFPSEDDYSDDSACEMKDISNDDPFDDPDCEFCNDFDEGVNSFTIDKTSNKEQEIIDDYLSAEGPQYFSYKIWVEENNIDSLKKFHEWFLDYRNQDYCDDYELDKKKCLDYFLFDMPQNRQSAEEIMSMLCIWEPYSLYEYILVFLDSFLTREEANKLMNRRYHIWLHENHISSLGDIYLWFTKKFKQGVSISRSAYKGKAAYEHLQQFLEEMPLTRKSAETIMAYKQRFHSKEFSSILATRFRHFLTEDEIDFFVNE